MVIFCFGLSMVFLWSFHGRSEFPTVVNEYALDRKFVVWNEMSMCVNTVVEAVPHAPVIIFGYPITNTMVAPSLVYGSSVGTQ